MNIDVYADGSATTSDKAGGWGSVILVDGVLRQELSGHLESATNNDAELIAAINGLQYVDSYLYSFMLESKMAPTHIEITLISDSEIVLNWANGTYKFKQIEKLSLYNTLMELVGKLNVKTKWVKGHSGDIWNSRCDKLANNARKGIKDLDKSPQNGDTRIGVKKTGVVTLWFHDQLKVIDLENNIVENYDRELHGKRGSIMEIREEKSR
jgi:ribonuclease HI